MLDADMCVCVCEGIDPPVDHLSPWMTAISREAILISVIISASISGVAGTTPN